MSIVCTLCTVCEYKGVHRVQYLCYGMRAIPACCDDSSTHGVFGSGGSFWTIPATRSGRFRVEHLFDPCRLGREKRMTIYATPKKAVVVTTAVVGMT
jgi:hypothetical protein